MKIVAMIPARLDSERILAKNLRPMGDTTLLGNAIRTALAVRAYDEVWVCTRDIVLQEEAQRHGAKVHVQPEEVAHGHASLDFKREFCERHDADYVVNHNPTAPMLRPETCERFCEVLTCGAFDVLHTVVRRQGCFLDATRQALNFDMTKHPRTQDLPPLFEVCWAVFGWNRRHFLDSACGIWAGRAGWFELSPEEGLQVRHDETELQAAQLLMRDRERP